MFYNPEGANLVVASPAKRPKASRAPERYDAFLTGELSVEDLDMEELLRGQLRDRNGNFTGRPSSMIPRAFHVKITQELLQRAEGTWRENMNDAMKVFVDIMNNERVRAQDRLYAAQYIIERVAGKIPEKQMIEASVRKWEDAAEAVIVEIVGDQIEDAEIVSSPEPVLGVVWEDEDTEDVETPPAIEAAPSTYTARKPKPRRPTRKAS